MRQVREEIYLVHYILEQHYKHLIHVDVYISIMLLIHTMAIIFRQLLIIINMLRVCHNKKCVEHIKAVQMFSYISKNTMYARILISITLKNLRQLFIR